MKWFNNLKIGTKLLSSFVLIAAIAGLIGWVGLSGMNRLGEMGDTMYTNQLVPLRDLGYANAAFLITRTEVRDFFLTKSREERRDSVRTIDEETGKTEKYIAAYAKTRLVKEEQETLAKFHAAFDRYKQLRQKALDMGLSGNDAGALAILNVEALTAQQESRQNLRALIDINVRIAEETKKAQDEAVAASRTAVLGSIGVGVLLAICLGLLLARMIGKPVRDMQAAAEKLALGDVNVSVELDSRDEIGALARSFRTMAEVIKDRTVLAQKIAAGDLTVDVKAKSEQDLLGKAFMQVVESLRKLIAETEMLTQAGVAGKLATRGNASEFQGGYRRIVEGVNQTLDAVIGPLNVSAEYVDRISKGDIPPKITDNYNGDFNEIKNNLNACIDAVRGVVVDGVALTQAAAEGKLATRADATKHQGDFKKVIEGFNQTLDAVIGPLNVSQANVVSRRVRGGQQERADGGDRHRGDDRLDQGNRQERQRGGQGRQRRRQGGRDDQRHHRQARRQLSRDRQGHQGDHLDRPADQPAGPQRHHRGGPRRRGRQGLRGGGQRGEGTGQGDRQGHRGHRPEDRGDSGRHQGRGRCHRQISQIIDQINDISNTIASAVEEQTATTNEISRNVSEAAKGSTEIAQNIVGVASAAKSTSEGAADTQKAAAELSRMAARLQTVVSQFAI
jgi:methyl-accepting chemotaxis protein